MEAKLLAQQGVPAVLLALKKGNRHLLDRGFIPDQPGYAASMVQLWKINLNSGSLQKETLVILRGLGLLCDPLTGSKDEIRRGSLSEASCNDK